MKNTFDDEIRSAMRVEPEDMTNMYNTQLTPEQETAFRASPYANDTFDYDARGEFLAGASRDNPTGHGQDTYKKPNHPTFSTGSQYHGIDGYSGGEWINNGDGTLGFVPSQSNIQMHSLDGLQTYLKSHEPYTRLLPRHR